MRLSRMTTTRSLIPKTSSMSELTMMIAMPSARELGHVAVDFGLCAHVDAACRLVEDQHFRAHGQPLAEHDFLLIAAREIHDLLLDRRRLGAQALTLSASATLRSVVRSKKPKRA